MKRSVDAGELARAKAQLKGGMFMGRESPAARAEQAAGQVLLFGRPRSARTMAEDIDAVGLEDLGRISELLLGRRQCAVSVLGPRPALRAGESFRRALFG